MLRKLKEWIIAKTIKHAESRFSIFVWMRQINDRLIRLENGQGEQAAQERAEVTMFFEAKLQTEQNKLAMLQEQVFP